MERETEGETESERKRERERCAWPDTFRLRQENRLIHDRQIDCALESGSSSTFSWLFGHCLWV